MIQPLSKERNGLSVPYDFDVRSLVR